jgi:hypothetical protein
MHDSFSLDSTHPDIAPTLQRASLATSKPVRVVSREVHTIARAHWDGGTQTLTTLVGCATDGDGLQDRTVTLGEFGAVVEWGTFCGKTAAITVYVNPTRFARIYPKGGPELTALQLSVVTAIATFNPRGRADFRDKQNMSKAEWDAVVAELTALGLTRKNGAITAEGRNAAN